MFAKDFVCKACSIEKWHGCIKTHINAKLTRFCRLLTVVECDGCGVDDIRGWWRMPQQTGMQQMWRRVERSVQRRPEEMEGRAMVKKVMLAPSLGGKGRLRIGDDGWRRWDCSLLA